MDNSNFSTKYFLPMRQQNEKLEFFVFSIRDTISSSTSPLKKKPFCVLLFLPALSPKTWKRLDIDNLLMHLQNPDLSMKKMAEKMLKEDKSLNNSSRTMKHFPWRGSAFARGRKSISQLLANQRRRRENSFCSDKTLQTIVVLLCKLRTRACSSTTSFSS